MADERIKDKTMIKNYRLTIKYDGTRYNGWQRQGNTPDTIQGKIEAVLAVMCKEQVELAGSGRTDAGVHALEQTANFKADIDMKPEEVKSYLNKYLPEDIAVVTADTVSERFHSRLNAKEKTYLYRIYTGKDKPVFDRRYLFVPGEEDKELNIENMKQAADYLIGEHDFKSFCGNKSMKKSTVRRIHEIRFEKKTDELDIFFTGNGFLQNMVRIITGTLLDVGKGCIKPDDMQKILLAKDRSSASGMAPAKGLTLVEVRY